MLLEKTYLSLMNMNNIYYSTEAKNKEGTSILWGFICAKNMFPIMPSVSGMKKHLFSVFNTDWPLY